jgi:hypothetical protein
LPAIGARRGLEVGVSLIVVDAALGESIPGPPGKIPIRCGRGSPRAGQRLKHLPGKRGTPRKAGELGEQALTRCGSTFEDLRVLAQGRRPGGAGSGVHNEQMGFPSGAVTLLFTDVEGGVGL